MDNKKPSAKFSDVATFKFGGVRVVFRDTPFAKKKDQNLVNGSYAKEKTLSHAQWEKFKGMWQAFVQSTHIRNGDVSTYSVLTMENGAMRSNASDIIRNCTDPCVPTKKKSNFFSFFNKKVKNGGVKMN